MFKILRILILSFLLFVEFYTLSAQIINAELIDYKTNISFENKTINTFKSYRIKINNRDGEYLSKISIPYSKLEKISNIQASIQDNSGKVIRKLNKNEITERSEFSEISFYEDHFVKEFTLKHNTYPYTINYSYNREQKEFFHICTWFPLINFEVPTTKATLNIEIPKSFGILFQSTYIHDFEIDTSDSKVNNYLWQSSYEEEIKFEIGSISAYNFCPKVEIVPKKFTYYAEGSFANWKAFGNWVCSLNSGLFDIPQNKKNEIHFLVAGMSDEKQKIKKLYEYVQDQTRYINISIETGDYKPYPASYVAKNNYGDCKALSNYFRAVLETVGIKSHYVLVNAGVGLAQIDKSFPSAQFNHAIVCIPLKNDTIWADCTSDNPFGYVGTFIQNRDALVIKKEGSHFAHIPNLTKNQVLTTRTIKINEYSNNEVLADFSVNFRSLNFEYLLHYKTYYNELQFSKIVREQYVEPCFDASNISLHKKNRDSTFIGLTYSGKLKNISKSYGNEIVISLTPYIFPHFEIPEKKKLPYQADYPIYEIDTLEYIISQGYIITNQLVNKKLSNDFGSISIDFYAENDKIIVVKSLFLNSGIYQGEKYKNFYQFIKNIEEIQSRTFIVLSKKI